MLRMRAALRAVVVVGLAAGLAAGLLALGCASAGGTAGADATAAARGAAADSTVRVTLLHLNDVYEITPVEGGRRGGLARVATLRRRLLAENPNTFTVLAGDLISPSALGTATVDGEALHGKQMIAVLNALGLDYATFGNHEFDLAESDLIARLSESRFTWFSANVFDARDRPFPGVLPHAILTVESPSGATVRIGLIGVTITEAEVDWVHYTDPLEAVRGEVAALGDSVDVRIALTHLALAEDVELAEEVPEIDLILGGHEHENVLVRRGADFTPILKADANARSAWVHDLVYDAAADRLEVDSRFVPISDEIPDDRAVAAVVDLWVERGYAGFRAEGFEPDEVVATVPVTLDGRESSVRNRPTDLTDLIAAAMLADAPGAELAVFNSGSIRIDDQIPPGVVTQYDVLRILPFGGKVQAAELRGRLLSRVLDEGARSRGSGGYLQTAGVTGEPGAWQVGGQPIQADRAYAVAINDYLAAGRQKGLEFLNPNDPDYLSLTDHDDVRKALIAELQRRYPSKEAPERGAGGRGTGREGTEEVGRLLPVGSAATDERPHPEG